MNIASYPYHSNALTFKAYKFDKNDDYTQRALEHVRRDPAGKEFLSALETNMGRMKSDGYLCLREYPFEDYGFVGTRYKIINLNTGDVVKIDNKQSILNGKRIICNNEDDFNPKKTYKSVGEAMYDLVFKKLLNPTPEDKQLFVEPKATGLYTEEDLNALEQILGKPCYSQDLKNAVLAALMPCLDKNNDSVIQREARRIINEYREDVSLSKI